MPDPVLYEAANGVATLTLNRPDRLNAWTRELGARFYELVERAAEDAEVRAIVVTGAGRGRRRQADDRLCASRPDRRVRLRLDAGQAGRSLPCPRPPDLRPCRPGG